MLLKSLFTSLFLISYLLSFTTSFRDLPMGTNTSAPKLQKRQFPTVYCGSKVSIRNARSLGAEIRTCTLGFAVKKVWGYGKFNHGYLTLGDCVPTRPIERGGPTYNVMLGPQNLVIGKTYSNQANLKYDPLEGLDYAVIRITNGQVWNDAKSMAIFSDGLDLNLPPAPIRTLKHLKRVELARGDEICYFSLYTSLICGELIFTDNEFTRYNPWINGQVDYFFRVGVVGLKFPPLPLDFNIGRREDYGAPVFKPVYCEDNCNPNAGKMVAAHPVGLFLDYSLMPFVVPRFHGLEPRLHLIPFSFYYQPLDRILANSPDLELILSPNLP